MAERGHGSKLRMPKPEEHLLVGDCFGGQGAGDSWDLGMALWEKRDSEGSPLPEVATASLELEQALCSSFRLQGPFGHTRFQIQFQLWSNLAHTCLCHSRTLGEQGEVSSCRTLPPLGHMAAAYSSRALKGSPKTGYPPHQPSTPSLPSPPRRKGPQQACSKEPAQHPCCPLCPPCISPPPGQLP